MPDGLSDEEARRYGELDKKLAAGGLSDDEAREYGALDKKLGAPPTTPTPQEAPRPSEPLFDPWADKTAGLGGLAADEQLGGYGTTPRLDPMAGLAEFNAQQSHKIGMAEAGDRQRREQEMFYGNFPLAPVLRPFMENLRDPTPTWDRGLKRGIEAAGGVLALPLNMTLGVVPGGQHAAQAAMQPVAAAGEYVRKKTGSEALGAATELAIPTAVGAGLIKAAPTLRGAVGELRGMREVARSAPPIPEIPTGRGTPAPPPAPLDVPPLARPMTAASRLPPLAERLFGPRESPRVGEPRPLDPNRPISAERLQTLGDRAWEGVEGAQAPSGSAFQGRSLGPQAGALRVPGVKPEPDVLPTGTPAERAAVEHVKERIQFGPPEKTPFSERVGQGLRTTYFKGVRHQAPVERLEKALGGRVAPDGPVALSEFAQGSSARGGDVLYREGFFDTETLPQSVRSALQAVHDSGRPLSDVGAFAAARRAVMSYEPRGLESGFDPGEAQVAMDSLGRNKAVVNAANTISSTYDALMDNLTQAAGWDPARRAAMKAANPFYVHFERILKDAGKPSVKGTAAPLPGETVSKVTGGKQPIADPLVLLQEDFRRMLAAADQARVRASIVKAVRAEPLKAQKFGIEEVPLSELKARTPAFQDVLDAVKDQTKVPSNKLPELWAKAMTDWNEVVGPEILPFFEKGKPAPRVFRVTDPNLVDFLRGTEDVNLEPTVGVFDAGTRLFRTGTTGASPSFAISNAIRDAKTYFTYTNAPVGKALGNYARGMYHGLRGELASLTGGKLSETVASEIAKRARSEGFFGVDRPKAMEDLARIDEGFLRYYLRRPGKAVVAPLKGGLDAFRAVNQIVESGPRIGEMLSELDNAGWKPGQPLTRDLLVRASRAHANITVPFKLGGQTATLLNRFYAFLKPRILGADLYARNWRANPGRMAVRAMAYSVAPKALLWAWWQKDQAHRDAYARIPPWRKLMFNIPYEREDGSIGSFPLPFVSEIDAPGIAAEAALNALANDDPKAGGDMAMELLRQNLPIEVPEGGNVFTKALGTVAPTVLKGPLEVATGRTSWGSKINPPGMEDARSVAPELVGREYDAPAAKWLSEFLHKWGDSTLTRAEIDHLIGRTFGTVGKSIARTQTTGTPEASDIPVVGRFVSRIKESRYVEDYYRIRDQFLGTVAAGRIGRNIGDETLSERFATSKALRGNIQQIDEALNKLRDEYGVAKTTSEKSRVARDMDELARAGLDIMQSVEIGSR